MRTLTKITLALLLLNASISFAQTGVTVLYYNGTSQQYNVATSGKLYFANDDLYLKVDAATAPTTIPVSIIRRITFSSTLDNTTFGENRDHLVLYPNPANETFRINAATFDDLNVKIYSLSGQLVKEGKYTVNQDIDITGLSSGLYLVQVNDTTLKFSKK